MFSTELKIEIINGIKENFSYPNIQLKVQQVGDNEIIVDTTHPKVKFIIVKSKTGYHSITSGLANGPSNILLKELLFHLGDVIKRTIEELEKREELEVLIENINNPVSSNFDSNESISEEEKIEIFDRLDKISSHFGDIYDSNNNIGSVTREEFLLGISEIKEFIKEENNKRRIRKFIMGSLSFLFANHEQVTHVFNYLVALVKEKIQLPDFTSNWIA